MDTPTEFRPVTAAPRTEQMFTSLPVDDLRSRSKCFCLSPSLCVSTDRGPPTGHPRWRRTVPPFYPPPRGPDPRVTSCPSGRSLSRRVHRRAMCWRPGRCVDVSGSSVNPLSGSEGDIGRCVVATGAHLLVGKNLETEGRRLYPTTPLRHRTRTEPLQTLTLLPT